MVESIQQPQFGHYKSLSADSELSSGYELLYAGEYSQCARVIKKKLPKLKSPIDKANFNILKVLLLHRTKKFHEKNELLAELKKEFLTNLEIQVNEPLMKHFKQILRNLDDEKGAQELLKVQLKNQNLASFDFKKQKEVLKELIFNFEFTDIYSKVNTFLKNPNDANVEFLKLIKYEMVYYLFLDKKLSEKMTKKVYDELLASYDTLKQEKGYFDILAQFSLKLNEKDKFIEIFTQKKKEEEFTNVPIEDIKYDIYLSQGKIIEIVNDLYNSIKSNIDKCMFNSFERIVNLFFWYIQKNNLKVDNSKINQIKEGTTEKIEDLNKTENVLNDIFSLFEYVKVNSGRNLNAYKSGVYGQLMIYHNLIGLNKQFPPEFSKNIYDLIISVLDKANTKQSILFEIGKYFIYLDEANRKKLLQNYCKKANINLDSFSPKDITTQHFDSFLFIQKLEKMLFELPKDKIPSKIMFLIQCYLYIINTITKDTKLEKGERNIADDLIILANEYYYENYTNKNKENDLAMLMLIINDFSHTKSPYNYDISYYFLQTQSHLNLYQSTLDTLKYMNLKGPQFETVSYIAFNPFLNYKTGLNYLVDNSEQWQSNNIKNTKKTLWKMFTGKNFWSSQELVDFLNQNKNSYYTILLQFYDVVINLNENYLNREGKDEEAEKDYFKYIINLYTSFEDKKNNNKLVRNQDMFVSMHKYRCSNFIYFNNDYEKIKKNVNYCRDNYKYEIDSLNKENNCLYKLYPGYKSNYIKECDTKPFEKYESYDFLSMRLLSLVTLTYLNDVAKLKEYNDKYIQIATQNNSEYDILLSSLIDKMIISSESVEKFLEKKDEILGLYNKFGDTIIAKINELQKNIAYTKFNLIAEMVSFFNEMKYFYLINFTNVSSKLVDFITKHKKEIPDAQTLKAQFNEKYKSLLINSLRELGKVLDNLINEGQKKDFSACKGGVLYEENNLILTEDAEFKKQMLQQGNGFSYLITLNIRDIFKEIKDYSKRIDDYIRQMI